MFFNTGNGPSGAGPRKKERKVSLVFRHTESEKKVRHMRTVDAAC